MSMRTAKGVHKILGAAAKRRQQLEQHIEAKGRCLYQGCGEPAVKIVEFIGNAFCFCEKHTQEVLQQQPREGGADE